MRRLANKRQRYLIFMVQNGLCAVCNRELPIDFEVDHQQPFSQKGKTELWNLQVMFDMSPRKDFLRKGQQAIVVVAAE